MARKKLDMLPDLDDFFLIAFNPEAYHSAAKIGCRDHNLVETLFALDSLTATRAHNAIFQDAEIFIGREQFKFVDLRFFRLGIGR